MSTIKLIKKVPAGAINQFNYTFECTCGDRSKKTVEVTSGNDDNAKKLAQHECDDECGES